MSFPLALRVAAQYNKPLQPLPLPGVWRGCRLCCYLSGRGVRRLIARAHTTLQLTSCVFLAQHNIACTQLVLRSSPSHRTCACSHDFYPVPVEGMRALMAGLSSLQELAIESCNDLLIGNTYAALSTLTTLTRLELARLRKSILSLPTTFLRCVAVSQHYSVAGAACGRGPC